MVLIVVVLSGCGMTTRVKVDTSCDVIGRKPPQISPSAITDVLSKDVTNDTLNNLNVADDYLQKLGENYVKFC